VSLLEHYNGSSGGCHFRKILLGRRRFRPRDCETLHQNLKKKHDKDVRVMPGHAEATYSQRWRRQEGICPVPSGQDYQWKTCFGWHWLSVRRSPVLEDSRKLCRIVKTNLPQIQQVLDDCWHWGRVNRWGRYAGVGGSKESLDQQLLKEFFNGKEKPNRGLTPTRPVRLRSCVQGVIWGVVRLQRRQRIFCLWWTPLTLGIAMSVVSWLRLFQEGTIPAQEVKDFTTYQASRPLLPSRYSSCERAHDQGHHFWVNSIGTVFPPLPAEFPNWGCGNSERRE